MAKILKSLQSEGGFSVAEATIIDENRNIIDAHTIKVLDNTNNKTFKKDYIIHGTLDDNNTSLEMTPTHLVETDRIVFVSAFLLGTWSGYPIAIYNSNANSTTINCELEDHGLTEGQLISVEFANPYTSFNGDYNITLIDDDNFYFSIGAPLDVNNPVLLNELEITSYSQTWEMQLK